MPTMLLINLFNCLTMWSNVLPILNNAFHYSWVSVNVLRAQFEILVNIHSQIVSYKHWPLTILNARSRGLSSGLGRRIMTERLWVQTPQSSHFSCTIHLDHKRGAKRDNGTFQLTWLCCMSCNPAYGRMDFEDGKLIKI